MPDFTMPSLGADMARGTLLEWLVKPGDTVRKGDIVAVVDTAKAAVDVETFVEGTVAELLVGPGTTVPVGAPLARIEPAAGPAAQSVALPAPGAGAAPGVLAGPAPGLDGAHAVPPPAPGPRPAPSPSAPLVSPLARLVAADLGVDLATVTGSGLRGRILRDDVLRAAGRPPSRPAQPRPAEPDHRRGPGRPEQGRPEPRPRATPYARRLARELGVDLTGVRAAGDVIRGEDVRRSAAHLETQLETQPAAQLETQPAAQPEAQTAAVAAPADRRSAMRRTIAALMARSKREVPHYYLTATVDLTRARAWMEERNRALPVADRLVLAALLMKATALAARRRPELNGFWVDDAFVPGRGVHLGVAVSLRGGGLVAPAVHDADTLALEELMAAVRDLVSRARGGRLRGSEMADPTLTVTNLGDQGVDSVHGVIYPPQVALVGFGRVAERPWAVDGMLAVRPVTVTTLAADHRATDGFTGGRFLATIDELLQTPEAL